MSRTSRVALIGSLAALVLLAVTACAPVRIVVASPSPTQDTPATASDELLAYAESERAAIPQILAQYPDLYSDVSIEGTVEEAADDSDLPAGTYSVMWYTYTYANPVDWDTATVTLDGQRGALDDACASQVFPAMRDAGVTGPLAAVYSYGDTTSTDPMWSHTCSSQ